EDPESGYYNTELCQLVRSTAPADQNKVFLLAVSGVFNAALCSKISPHHAECVAEIRTAWQEEQIAAAYANDPCQFTSFVAYEWTSSPGATMQHRNVVFGTAQVPTAPLDSLQYTSASSLWNGLEQQCTSETGCAAITIPHNTNYSAGG